MLLSGELKKHLLMVQEQAEERFVKWIIEPSCFVKTKVIVENWAFYW